MGGNRCRDLGEGHKKTEQGWMYLPAEEARLASGIEARRAVCVWGGGGDEGFPFPRSQRPSLTRPSVLQKHERKDSFVSDGFVSRDLRWKLLKI